MATAKLWWNGSAWKTTEAFWVNDTRLTGPLENSLAADHQIEIVAYDNFSIKLSQTVKVYQTSAIYYDVTNDGTVTVKSGGTTLGTNSFTATVTNYTAFSYSGTINARGWYSGGSRGSGDIDRSGSTTISISPFYTVTYNANGGSGAPSSNKGVKGFSTKVANGTPTRSGWTFKGWATSNTATSATYQAGDTIPARSSDLPLYAVWHKNITIKAPQGVTISFGGTNYTNKTVTVQKAYGTYALSMTAQSGWIIKSRSPAASVTQVVIARTGTTPADIATIEATSQRVGCHLDTGAAWEQELIYIDNGASWDLYLAYIDDGAQWRLMY